MGYKVYLCASSYPRRDETIRQVGINVEDSIDGYVKAIGRHEILPFLGAYQRMVYSYFFFKRLIKSYRLDFVIVTGGSTLIPSGMAEKTIVYVHYPINLEVVHQRYLSSKAKRVYIKPWRFISDNLDYIKKATLIANSDYTKQAVKLAWGMDARVIYPPCPQYFFKLTNQAKEDTVCSIGRFTPEKEYETILEIARRQPNIRFELIGRVTRDKFQYFEELKGNAPTNVVFHANAGIQEKIEVLLKSKVLIHGFIGEHFGIALVEAMSAGAIPVAHNSGAAEVDNLVSPEFRYNNMNEAIEAIDRALSSWNLNEAYRLREVAKRFSPESFKRNLKQFISDWINL
jgi:alpha-1,2-mannosyltransferase